MANIVVCCDGTSNEFGTVRTNVPKLVHCLEQSPARQRIHYHPGVGTMPHPGAISHGMQIATQLAGLAFGYGLRDDVRDLYTYIMNTWQPGDDIYLIGFSRGAFTVRAVAALIHSYGLLPAGNNALVPYAVRYHFNAITKARNDADIADALERAGDFKATFCAGRHCPIHFVGVWDTVGSVGWFTNPVVLPHTADNPGIAHTRHALAIDERRAFFRPNRWRRNALPGPHGPIDVKEVWFAGSHCDVGGGYNDDECGLSDLALEWMLDEAEALGLMIDQARKSELITRPGREAPKRIVHDSLTGIWPPFEYVPKPNRRTKTWRVNRARPRRIDATDTLHWSVLEQPRGYLEERGLPGGHPIEPRKLH